MFNECIKDDNSVTSLMNNHFYVSGFQSSLGPHPESSSPEREVQDPKVHRQRDQGDPNPG